MRADGLKRVSNVLAGYAIASATITATFIFVAKKFTSRINEYEYEYQLPLIILLFFGLSVVFAITSIILTVEAAAESQAKRSQMRLGLDN